MRPPRAAAYMEALQDPATCFADPVLAGAAPVLSPLGLPRATSGSVATVFAVDGTDGRRWAVRCFVRPLADQRERYEAVRAHLAGLESTWRVAFEFQPCGIRIEGAWWPIVKMEWAAGEPLLAYVERHLWDGAALGYLADRFAALARRLRDERVAHGDLQHGNILVAPGGDLRLVDYDGMFVTALSGRAGTERGHRNYQHPGRLVSDFGPDLDSFSAWTIYASLTALAADPLLWGRLDGGEEALLLRQHDLEEPSRSTALAVMEASTAPGVARLGSMLRSLLALPAADVPPLDPTLVTLHPAAVGVASGGAVADPDRGPGRAVGGGRGPVTRRRWRGRPGPEAPAAPTGLLAPAGVGGLTAEGLARVASLTGPEADASRQRSLYEALTAVATAAGRPGDARGTDLTAAHSPVRFGSDLREARRTLAAGAGAAGVFLAAAAMAGAAPVVSAAWLLTIAGVCLARVHHLFRHTPEARAASEVGAALARPRRAVDDAAAAVAGLVGRRTAIATAEAAAARQALADQAALQARQEEELQAVDAELEGALAAVATRERAAARAEREARAAALADLQRAVIHAQLGQHSLVAATAAGVGKEFVHRLALDGVRTAADFTDVRVEKAGATLLSTGGRRIKVNGLDERQAEAMVTWRRRAYELAQLKVPDALPRERAAAIGAEFDAVRAGLATEAETCRRAAQRRADDIRSRWAPEREQVALSRKESETEAARRRVELDRELSQARKAVAEAQWLLARSEEEAGPGAEPRFSAYLRQVLAVGPFAAGREHPGGGSRAGSATRSD